MMSTRYEDIGPVIFTTRELLACAERQLRRLKDASQPLAGEARDEINLDVDLMDRIVGLMWARDEDERAGVRRNAIKGLERLLEHHVHERDLSEKG